MSEKNHAISLIRQNWAMLVFGCAVVGSLITMYFQLQFVIAAVNPESIAEFRVETAVLETKRHIRWCLGKMLIEGGSPPAKHILECAD